MGPSFLAHVYKNVLDYCFDEFDPLARTQFCSLDTFGSGVEAFGDQRAKRTGEWAGQETVGLDHH